MLDEVELMKTAPKNKEAHLEVVVQFMRSRLGQAQGETLELQNKIHHLNQLILRHQIEVQQHLAAFENEKKKNGELTLEENALKSQFVKLKEQIKLLEEEKKSWSAKTSDQQSALQNGEKEIELLKAMMMKTVHEFKEERLVENEHYHQQIEDLTAQTSTKQKEIEDLQELFHEKEQSIRHLTLDLEEKSSSLHQLSNDLQIKNTAHFELTKFTEDLQAKMIQAEALREQNSESLKKKEELIEHLSSQVASLSKSLADREEAFQNIEEERHEHETCLRASQAHLAKKVRETAHLAEKYEEAQDRTRQLEKEKESSDKKLLEIQALLDAEHQHKLKVQEQHQENLKTVEAQSAKWEEKYFNLHDKWQEVEGKNRELKRLEERFSKMQIAFSHFNQLFASPYSMPQAEEIPIKNFAEKETVPTQEKSAAFQPSLFQSPKGPSRFKETLFG
jgi:chromosome segregation ATPase